MGKYGQYVGKIELKIGEFNKEITPKVGDGRQFLKIITSAESNKELLFEKFAPYMFNILAREEPELTDEDKQELESFIDMNLMTFFNEVMIAFNMTTREELEQQKKDTLQVLNKSKDK